MCLRVSSTSVLLVSAYAVAQHMPSKHFKDERTDLEVHRTVQGVEPAVYGVRNRQQRTLPEILLFPTPVLAPHSFNISAICYFYGNPLRLLSTHDLEG